jgi:hypothetical protein
MADLTAWMPPPQGEKTDDARGVIVQDRPGVRHPLNFDLPDSCAPGSIGQWRFSRCSRLPCRGMVAARDGQLEERPSISRSGTKSRP